MQAELLKVIIGSLVTVIVVLLWLIAIMQVKIHKYKRKVYFIKRDRERCNELLFSVKDGYMCFIYPDQKIKDAQKETKENCSRRLAVMLNLKNGTASKFDDVADSFYKDDASRLKKYVGLLQKEGHVFEDMLRLKGNLRYICVYGNRIHGSDNNLYCDIVWFRDVTEQNNEIMRLQNDKNQVVSNLKQLENMIDGLNIPLWLRDDQMKLLAVNKKYLDFVNASSKNEVLLNGSEIQDNKGKKVVYQLAVSALKSKKMQKKALNVVLGGGLHRFEAYENPYFMGDTLDKIGTVGYMLDNTSLEEAKHNFEVNQNNHLAVLGVLGTAFAIFDNKTNLYFYNEAFKNLWQIENDFLDKTPNYSQFIEVIREHKMLPPVPDFKAYKEDELSVFNRLWETKEDLLHLPDGRTIRRFRTPHPNGVVFAFEDVSDRLATMRRLNDLTSMQQAMLDNLNDGVIVFGANQRLKFYNRTYLKMWGVDFDKMQDEPKLDKIISYQKLFFSNIDDWTDFKQTMMSHIIEGRKFTLSRDDGVNIKVSPLSFYDGSLMLAYTII